MSVWTYFSQTSGNIEDDDSLKVTCGASEFLVMVEPVSIAHISECSGAIPSAPSGATVDHDGSDTAGSVVTYTCSAGHKVYASVSSRRGLSVGGQNGDLQPTNSLSLAKNQTQGT